MDLRYVMAGRTLSDRPATAIEVASRLAADAHFGFMNPDVSGREIDLFRSGYEHAAYGRNEYYRDGTSAAYDAGFEAAIAAPA